MSDPLRNISSINLSYDDPFFCIARNTDTARPHADFLKNVLPVRTFENGSLRPLFIRNAVIGESLLYAWQIINARKTALHSEFAKFYPQSDIACIRRFDPG